MSLEFFIDIKSFRSHYGPGVDSAANRNEYQEYFLGVKAAGALRLTTLPPSCAVVTKSGDLNFLEPSGSLQACNGTALPFTCFEHHVLIIRRSKLYYTASGIVTPVGGRPVHGLREDTKITKITKTKTVTFNRPQLMYPEPIKHNRFFNALS